MPQLTDILDVFDLPPSLLRQEQAMHSDSPDIKTCMRLFAFQTRIRPTLFVFFASCASGRDISEHSFIVANFISGLCWRQWSSLAATARNLVVSATQDRQCPRSPRPWSPPRLLLVASGLALELEYLDHLFHIAWIRFDPTESSGTPSYRSVEDLELLVQISCFFIHSCLNLVPLPTLLDLPPGFFPGGRVAVTSQCIGESMLLFLFPLTPARQDCYSHFTHEME